jgi:hypothetical protein
MKETTMITITRFIRPLGSLAFSAAILASAPIYAENAMQCSQKLHSTLYGRSATAAELNIADPISQVDSMIQNNEFRVEFAKYINAHMNWVPGGERISENPVYSAVVNYLFKPRNNDLEALNSEYPWKNLFTVGYETYDSGWNPKSTEDNGLNLEASGYFSNKLWKSIYKGNEEAGVKLRTAYLIMNNQIGLSLDALTVNNSGGSGVAARTDPNSVCAACHLFPEFALDRVANVLPLVNRQTSDAQNFNELPSPNTTPQMIYGSPVSNLKELTAVLAELDQFDTNACDIAFQFVFGRERRSADNSIFQACITEFQDSGYITTAVRHFIESEIFCKDGV